MANLRDALQVATGLLVWVGAGQAAPGANGEPFDYFRNSWSVIGLKDYADGTRVTPDNELLLADGATVRIRWGRDLRPLSREQTKTLMDGWLPIVQLSAREGVIVYDFTFWATPLPSVANWRRAFATKRT